MTAQQSTSGGTMATVVRVIRQYLSQLGPLRVVLCLFSLTAVVLAPGGDQVQDFEGIGLFLTVILPTLAPLFLTGHLLDSMMCKIVMGDHDDAGRARLRVIIRTNLFLSLLLVLSWLPFFMSIFQ
ncbi:hypothetical protein J2T57_003793 [Natronocella acetinitrilica]|uniref:Uncharacterized protein n=1 Tax=Natronocella acetinitrilica TaxID=414046 RepID=A0AAE3G724_9GAMM|nr:hypothetical protein [Natronocella acetinitrilica]MCP1676622.1 hypothetical protein [Natronocella acetinitrilica]